MLLIRLYMCTMIYIFYFQINHNIKIFMWTFYTTRTALLFESFHFLYNYQKRIWFQICKISISNLYRFFMGSDNRYLYFFYERWHFNIEEQCGGSIFVSYTKSKITVIWIINTLMLTYSVNARSLTWISSWIYVSYFWNINISLDLHDIKILF